MEKLIPIINKLQDVFTTVGTQPIDLPQIVVVGSQSVGKSSVLESIVGRDFLPRGNDIVTRRPLILQLHHVTDKLRVKVKPGDSSSSAMSDSSISASPEIAEFEEWAEFLHLRGRKFTNFDRVREEIELQTDEVAPMKAISAEPINLKIYSPNVLNLTLVDLPGITKIPVGNQPADIEERIIRLVKEFVNRPRCLILAVSAATSDLATSDAIQLSRKVDPKGLRTLGVMTKLDLMDAGTDAYDVLTNQVYPLQLGYVGVVNRSQKDIMDAKPMKAAREAEEQFFRMHPTYRNIASKCGTSYLCTILNKILMNHIRRYLPELKTQIDANIVNLRRELELYGSPLKFAADDIESEFSEAALSKFSTSDESKSSSSVSRAGGFGAVTAAHSASTMVLHLINKFGDNFTHAIDGTGAVNMQRQAALQASPPSTVASIAKHRRSQAGAGPSIGGVFDPSSSSSPSLSRGSVSGRRGSSAVRSMAASRGAGGNNNGNELFGGARILYIFRTEFHFALSEIRAFDGLRDEFIINSIRNASGIRSALFIPEQCFENLVKLQIEKLRQPALHCVEMVFEELKRLSVQCQTPEISRFPRFKAALNECVVKLLKRLLRPAQMFINNLIEVELAYINTNHPDFIQMEDVFAFAGGGGSSSSKSSSGGGRRRAVESGGGSGSRSGSRSGRSGSRVSSMEARRHGGAADLGTGSSGSRSSGGGSGGGSSSAAGPRSGPESSGVGGGSSADKSSQGSSAGGSQDREKGESKSGGLFGFFGGSSGQSSKHDGSGKSSSDKGRSSKPDYPPPSASAGTGSRSSESIPSEGVHSRDGDSEVAALRPAKPFESRKRDVVDPHFYGDIPAHLEQRLTSREKQELRVIKQFIKSYFDIVKQKVSDTVPKSTMCFLVNSAREQVQTELAVALYKSEKETRQLLAESPEIAAKRQAAQDLLNVMLKALEIIDEVKDYSFTKSEGFSRE